MCVQAIKVNQHNAASWLILIDYYQQMNDSVRYASTLSEALAANPENGTLHFYPGSLDMERGHDLSHCANGNRLPLCCRPIIPRNSALRWSMGSLRMCICRSRAWPIRLITIMSWRWRPSDNALVLNNHAYTLTQSTTATLTKRSG